MCCICSATHYYNINDTAKIKTLGIADKSFKAQNWFYNIAPVYNVTSISLVNASDRSYQINTKTEHTCRIGDSVTLIGSSVGTYASSIIIEILDSKSFVIRGQGDIDVADTYTIKRNILKASSNTFPEAVQYSTNVQNVYTSGGKYLIDVTNRIRTRKLNIQRKNIFLKKVFVFLKRKFQVRD